VIDGIAGFLNDLWRFDGSRWTWMSGNAGVNEPGVYGTKGVGSIANVPPGREAPVGWTDAAGNLWLFGGGGRDASGNYVWLNDLWRAEP
jgi:hypothetical protein